MFYSSNFQLLEHTSKLTELTLMVVTSSGCQNHNLELDKSVFVKLLRLKILFTFSLFYFMFHQIMINYTKVNLSSASSICALLDLSSRYFVYNFIVTAPNIGRLFIYSNSRVATYCQDKMSSKLNGAGKSSKNNTFQSQMANLELFSTWTT